MEPTTRHPNRHTETSRRGSNRRAGYYTASRCVWGLGEQLLSYVQDAQTSKGAWENLKKVFAASTRARKLQLRQELSNLRQRDLSVVDYTSKIKDICDSLASIEVNIEESEMVQICLRGLAPKFKAFRTTVSTREKTPFFFDLQSMLLVEENHAGASTSTHNDSRMLYMEGDRPRGRGGRGESVRNGGGRRCREENRPREELEHQGV